MKQTLFAFVLGFALCLLLMPVSAQEKIVNGTTITFAAPASIPDYEPVTFTVQRFVAGVTDKSSITLSVVGADHKLLVFSYPDASVPALSTEAQVAALITSFKSANFSTAFVGANSGNLWQRAQFFICRDFASRFNNGCTVQ